MLSSILSPWKTALEVKRFRVKCITSIILLALCAIVAPPLFQFIQEREGPVLSDYLLNLLPSYDLSSWVFILLYLLIFAALVFLITRPHHLLVALQAYIILTLLRFITLLLFPLNAPEGILELNDPFVQYFFYQQSVTKDLFFSGHTSLVFLLAFSSPLSWLRIVLFIGGTLLASMLLLQHAHYSIDIAAAPCFSWLAYVLAKKIP